MNARDELAKLLFVTDNHAAPEPDHEWEMTTHHNPKHAEYVFAMAEAVLAAGYTKPRTIETAEELDALPDNSVIEDGAGDVGVVMAGNVWYPETAPIPVRKVAKSYIPATVLYEPGQS